MIRKRAGLEPQALGASALAIAIKRRMAARGLADRSQYMPLLSSNASEWNAFLDELLVPESWFFRGGRVLFNSLAEKLVTLSQTESRSARLLSIPCGLGEEPYSLAIALEERRTPPESVLIHAADLSVGHLIKAQEARFSHFSLREIDSHIRDRYFRMDSAGLWHLDPKIRTRVTFSRCNLAQADEAHLGQFDAIICRNVFIYLTDEGRQQAVANLRAWLRPAGFLCVSPAEADRLPRQVFEHLPSESGLFYRLRRSRTQSSSAAIPTPLPPPAVSARTGKSASLSAQRLDPSSPSETTSQKAGRENTPTLASTASVIPPGPGNPSGTLSLHQIRDLANRGELRQALAACEKLLVGGLTSSADAYSLYGVLHLASGQADAAVDAFTRALYLAPDHPEALEHLAILSEQRGQANHAAALRRRLKRRAVHEGKEDSE